MSWNTETYDKDKSRLTKTFEFNDFIEAWGFMSRVAILAEKHNHHPNWQNVYKTVEIKLNTHDAGNIITEKDHNLASAIDRLVD
jgi:4a-hydroxytetrahydrobiopterin dehydratase